MVCGSPATGNGSLGIRFHPGLQGCLEGNGEVVTSGSPTKALGVDGNSSDCDGSR